MPEPQQPKCPGCGHAPLRFLHNIVRMESAALISIVWCADCGLTMGTQYIGQDQSRKPLLTVPN